MTTSINVNGHDFTISDTDVVNPDEFIPAGEYNPHRVRPFVLHDHGTVLAVAFADCLQDALDAIVDGSDKLDHLRVSDDDMADYGDEEEGITRLGNAGEPFDLGGVDAFELPIPARSFVAQLAEHMANAPAPSR